MFIKTIGVEKDRHVMSGQSLLTKLYPGGGAVMTNRFFNGYQMSLRQSERA
nr:hypothetical protein [Legionella beliardensis]